MKRLIGIAIILCVAFGFAFAARGDLDVGVMIGYGKEFFNWNYKTIADSESTLYVGGLNVNGTASYSLHNFAAVKVEVGINTMGDAVLYNSTYKDGQTISSDVPANVNLYVGGESLFNLGRDFYLGTGVGLDAMYGRQLNLSTETESLRLGVGFELFGRYSLNENISVNLGVKASLYFLNIGGDTNYVTHILNTEETNGSLNYLPGAMNFLAGVTYRI